MKKLFAVAAITLMLTAGSTSVFAARDPLYSPESVTITITPPPGSPKTGDISVLPMGCAGVAALGVALFAAKRSRDAE